MYIEKVIINNFKSIKYLEIDLNRNVNIIVGNNEVGKSTILEAIHLAMTMQINGRNLISELSHSLFNNDLTKQYINSLIAGNTTELPIIFIELFFNSDSCLAFLEGTNNSKRINSPGISLQICFNEDFAQEYLEYIKNPEEVINIPTEYYHIKWMSFAGNAISIRTLPLKSTFIDTSTMKTNTGTDKFISNLVVDMLDSKERADLTLTYRKMKEQFTKEQKISEINNNLNADKHDISSKELSVALDLSNKTNWESVLTLFLDEIPFQHIGKGEQSSVKMKIALESKATTSNIVLIEEPENHLSYSNMSKLINEIQAKCCDQQLVITTHSTFVANKLGLSNLILMNDECNVTSMKNLDDDTQRYFMKLPGYDTLRLIVSKEAILVEGPSDELIVQKAYIKKYAKLPIEDGKDVITVKGLSFKRFLEIASLLNKRVVVITDNDGDLDKIKSKYKDYNQKQNILISYDSREELRTLEPQFIDCNDIQKLNQIFGRKDDYDELLHYMLTNKTEWALEIFLTQEEIEIPRYITDVI